MSRRTFDLLAGAACLDLINTCDHREEDSGRPVDDYLETPEDLLQFLAAAGLAAGEELRALRQADEASLRRLLRETRRMREDLHALFLRIAGKLAPREADLEPVNGWIEKLAGRKLLRVHKGSARLDRRREDPEDVLVAVIDSAIEVLSPSLVERIKICGGPECGWLFLDTSKNGGRRWCDMADCGNRAKAARFYEKKRTG